MKSSTSNSDNPVKEKPDKQEYIAVMSGPILFGVMLCDTRRAYPEITEKVSYDPTKPEKSIHDTLIPYMTGNRLITFAYPGNMTFTEYAQIAFFYILARFTNSPEYENGKKVIRFTIDDLLLDRHVKPSYNTRLAEYKRFENALPALKALRLYNYEEYEEVIHKGKAKIPFRFDDLPFLSCTTFGFNPVNKDDPISEEDIKNTVYQFEFGTKMSEYIEKTNYISYISENIRNYNLYNTASFKSLLALNYRDGQNKNKTKPIKDGAVRYKVKTLLQDFGIPLKEDIPTTTREGKRRAAGPRWITIIPFFDRLDKMKEDGNITSYTFYCDGVKYEDMDLEVISYEEFIRGVVEIRNPDQPRTVKSSRTPRKKAGDNK